MRGADDAARASQHGVRRAFRETEVRQRRGAILVDHDVRRLHVPVDQPGGVQRIEARADLRHETQNLRNVEGPIPPETLREGAAGDIARHDVRPSILLARIDDGDEVGMLDRRRCARFVAEAHPIHLLAPQLGLHHLDGDHGAVRLADCPVHRSDRTLAHRRNEPVRADRPPGPDVVVHRIRASSDKRLYCFRRATVTTDARIGSEIAGYRLEALLGRGGMGIVYRADDPGLGRKVALKVLPPELAEDERFRERFLRESRLAALIEHPNIVPVHDAGEADGFLYIAMRYVPGIDLKRLLEREGPLDPSRTLSLLRQVGEALDAAHTRGLVHRDVKPGNILVSHSDHGEHAYLTDFGISQDGVSTRALTRTGELVGSVAYVAPEQIEGAPVEGGSDVYALATVLFECLAGASPFRRETDYAVLWAKLHEPPPVLSRVRADLPSGLDDVLSRALARQPGDRYPSCEAMVAAASDALGLLESTPGRTATTTPLTASVREAADLILQGRVVPLLGTGANSCGRPGGQAWKPASPDVLPDGQDLATRLAESFGYPADEPSDLAHVSQYISLTKGSGPLYDELHELLHADFVPGPVHRLLAEIPALLRRRGVNHQLIVTTNYDRAMEDALTEASEEFDVVSYVATGTDKGRFVHTSPDGKATLIDVPNSYGGLSLDERTVILKLHGQVDVDPARDRESFVVTEDDYIDYVANVDVSSLVPVTLAAVLRRSHFLFLGYSLRDWYPRGVLYRTWGEQRLTYRSWAVDSRSRRLSASSGDTAMSRASTRPSRPTSTNSASGSPTEHPPERRRYGARTRTLAGVQTKETLTQCFTSTSRRALTSSG